MMITEHPDNPELDDFLAQLREFYVTCGKPAYKALADISWRLDKLYPMPDGGKRSLPHLSASGIYEVLVGRRKGFPSAGWLASFVLCCQRRALEMGVRTVDPGPTTLPEWQQKLRAARAGGGSAGTDRPGGQPRQEDSGSAGGSQPRREPRRQVRRDDGPGAPGAPGAPPAPPAPPQGPRAAIDPGGAGLGLARSATIQAAAVRSAVPVHLSDPLRGYVASYGPYGEQLLADMQTGDMDAVYRVAVLLLGADSLSGRAEAQRLLIYAGAGGHHDALDLLDSNPVHLDRYDAGGHATRLAEVATGEGGREAALVFLECAARCGLPAASVKLADMLLAEGNEGEAVRWLAVAADQGDTRAQIRLETLRRAGRIPPAAPPIEPPAGEGTTGCN